MDEAIRRTARETRERTFARIDEKPEAEEVPLGRVIQEDAALAATAVVMKGLGAADGLRSAVMRRDRAVQEAPCTRVLVVPRTWYMRPRGSAPVEAYPRASSLAARGGTPTRKMIEGRLRRRREPTVQRGESCNRRAPHVR
jgi:hypothetical protein